MPNENAEGAQGRVEGAQELSAGQESAETGAEPDGVGTEDEQDALKPGQKTDRRSTVTELDTTATDRILQLIATVRARGLDVRLVRSVAPAQDKYTGFELRTILSQTAAYPSREAALERIPRSTESIIEHPEESASKQR